jgi:hypothetical protein
MNLIKAVKVGWKELEDILNGMIKGINRRTIINGAGLSKQETDSGTMLWITKLGDSEGNDAGGGAATDPWRITPDGETAGWHAVQVMDENCNRFSMYVWGGTPK